MSERPEPKWWFTVLKCGCKLTSTNHPWVRQGLSLSGEYVNFCETHNPRRQEANPHKQTP